MSSITFWNRVEPRPRSTDITNALAARVRDPLWMLTRQWQFGEFAGEDAASPAYAAYELRCSPMQAWSVPGMPAPRQIVDGPPMEAQTLAEPWTPDLSTRVELGQRFERLLRAAALESTIAALPNAYMVARPAGDVLAAMRDQDAARFLRVCGGRATDGVRIYVDAHASVESLLTAWGLAGATRASAAAVVAAFVTEVTARYGEFAERDPGAWRPSRLEYSLAVHATTPSGEAKVLTAQPEREGGLDWHTFDLSPAASTVAAGAVVDVRHSTIPTHLRFRGMPNVRWWHFESGETNFGGIQPDTRDLGRLVLMDFMLVQGDDWYVLPVTQPAGHLCSVAFLVVHDVFGGDTWIDRADRAGVGVPPPGSRWTMYSTSIVGDATRLAPFFLLPPSGTSAIHRAKPLEEVRFLRDETANMAWAIEEQVENAIGAAWRGHERDQSGRPVAPVRGRPLDTSRSAQPLRYRIQTETPVHWIPFVPVAIDSTRRAVALQRATMLDPTPDGTGTPIVPVGRILRPTQSAGGRYFVYEEEVPREGVRVKRIAHRARGLDGSTHIWIARTKVPGAGEGSSGLRFDLADDVP